jgi:hypothetical protein
MMVSDPDRTLYHTVECVKCDGIGWIYEDFGVKSMPCEYCSEGRTAVPLSEFFYVGR